MKNVEMKLEGHILTIKVDVTKEFGPSASGKTIIIASTEGNISIPDKDDLKNRVKCLEKETRGGIKNPSSYGSLEGLCYINRSCLLL